jgi:hypothetical protein
MRKWHCSASFLVSALALLFASTGIGWAQQVSVGGVVPITSLGTRTPIPSPALTPEGGPLIFSDAPEILNDTMDLPGAMYRDQVEGEFRVFYHHQNKTSGALSIGVGLTNTTDQSELLFAIGQGRGLSVFPDLAGQAALSEFLASHQSVSFLATLSSGKTYWAVQSVPVGDTASAILQYALVTVPAGAETTSVPLALLQDLNPAPFGAQGKFVNHPALPAGFGYGAATVTTLAYSGQQPSDPTTIPILPAVRPTRGTFPHFDRFGSFTITTARGLQVLGVDTALPQAMPGEYEQGVDAVDGGVKIYDAGNYGVLYNFRVLVENSDPDQPTPFALLMWPSGGFGHYVMLTDGNLALSPFVNYKNAWWFDELTLHGVPAVMDLETSLTGGSFGPQRLLFDPGFNGQ